MNLIGLSKTLLEHQTQSNFNSYCHHSTKLSIFQILNENGQIIYQIEAHDVRIKFITLPRRGYAEVGHKVSVND